LSATPLTLGGAVWMTDTAADFSSDSLRKKR
jgi:hypothetical protein